MLSINLSFLLLLAISSLASGFEHSSVRTREVAALQQETDEFATIQRVLESVKRRTGLSQSCETETFRLWNASQLQITFPRITQEEFNTICQQDGQNLICDLSLSEFYTMFSERCTSSGGKIIDVDLAISNSCYDTSRSASSIANFKHLGTCGGTSCEVKEFQELVDGILNSSVGPSSACSFEVSSVSQAGVSSTVVAIILVATISFL
jgi:hypothetical protein